MKQSSFTIILTFAILMIVGIALAPLLEIEGSPASIQGKCIVINLRWPDMPANIVEQNLTSPVEGMVETVRDIESVESKSYFGGSRIIVKLKKGSDVSAARFEIASILRQSYDRLPKGVEVPTVTGGEINGEFESQKLLLTYQVNSNMPQDKVKSCLDNIVLRNLEAIDGIGKIEVSGMTDYFIDVSYNPDLLATNGISVQDVSDGIAAYLGKEDVIGSIVQNNNDKERVSLRVSAAMLDKPLGEVPLKKKGEKMLYLNDLATVCVRKCDPESFYRVNGLNTIYINVFIPNDGKTVYMSSKIQKKMASIITEVNKNCKDVCFRMSYDCAAQQRIEMFKLVWRTLLSLFALLVFVWIIYRNRKYLVIVALALMANMFIALVCYVVFGVKLHPFSLAAITVSLGLVIDSTIVMADHYGYFHDRRAFAPLLASMLTTIGSMAIIFFLPENVRHNLYDFALVVILNLVVSLAVSFFFVPAMIDYFHYSNHNGRLKYGYAIVKWNKFYFNYIRLTSRYRHLIIVCWVWCVGVPLGLLPEKISLKGADSCADNEKVGVEIPWYCTVYNETFGCDFFQKKCKPVLSKCFGGILEMFVNHIQNESEASDDNEEMSLHILAQVPIGGTAVQLNEKMIEVEDFLKKYNGIQGFTTSIDGRNGEIIVKFKENVLDTGFPYELENDVIGKVIMIGGAEWATYGVSKRGFSNSLNLQYRANGITLTGYDYNQLLYLTERTAEDMAHNKRIQDIKIETPGFENQEEEFFMDYDRPKMGRMNISPYNVHRKLGSLLSGHSVGNYCKEGFSADVVVRPIATSALDRWHLENEQIFVDSVNMFVRDIMDVHRREAKNVIPKQNQQYVLNIAFNVKGSLSYASELINKTVKKINKSLPLGYRCREQQFSDYAEERADYLLLLVVATVVFVICSIQFESLRLAGVIMSVVPFSMVGLFLTFCISGVPFGSGGLASMVMLVGIVVNSGIYLISQYEVYKRRVSPKVKNFGYINVKCYLRAYNHKIAPVSLTVISTIIGLVPFFVDEKDNAFWLSFATGVTGGLLLSLPAVVFIMPLFLKFRQ